MASLPGGVVSFSDQEVAQEKRTMLLVKVSDAFTVRGGRAVLLCDADGEPLPEQVSCTVQCEAGESATVTVTLLIDGEEVRFA